MNELKILMADNESMRELVGLYEVEKERADKLEKSYFRLLHSMRCIAAWAHGSHGADLAQSLRDIEVEADAAIVTETKESESTNV